MADPILIPCRDGAWPQITDVKIGNKTSIDPLFDSAVEALACYCKRAGCPEPAAVVPDGGPRLPLCAAHLTALAARLP